MKFFGNFLAKERRNRAESSRKLRLEALENRELLSADGITPLVTTATSDATQLVVTTLDDVVECYVRSVFDGKDHAQQPD